VDDEHHRLVRIVGFEPGKMGCFGIFLREEHPLQLRHLAGAREHHGQRDGEVGGEMHGPAVEGDGLFLQGILEGEDAAVALEAGHGRHSVKELLGEVVGAPLLVGPFSDGDDRCADPGPGHMFLHIVSADGELVGWREIVERRIPHRARIALIGQQEDSAPGGNLERLCPGVQLPGLDDPTMRDTAKL